MRHGAKVKGCSSEGCTNYAMKGGVCIRHGAKVECKRCSSEGCTNRAVKGGVCKRHGAKTKKCSADGCLNKAKNGGVCIRHGAKVKKCSSKGCTNHARRGGVCIKHAANRNPNYDESTAFGSELDKTTTADPSTTNALDERSNAGVPGEVVICQEIVEV